MTEFLNLKLNEYFNNKIIADESSVTWIKENIENFGMFDICGYFLSNSLPASDENIHINNVSYIFPDKSQNKLDNISCEEQEICIPNVRCNAIHFLGTSEFDDCEEYNISFSKGNSTKYSMFMPGAYSGSEEWKYAKSDYKRAIKGIFSNLSPHWFYYYSTILDIKQDDYITGITLPYNPDIHILAITLEYCIDSSNSNY